MPGWMKDIGQMVFFGAIVAVMLSFVVYPYRISGNSMEPTYKNGSLVLVDKLSYKIREPLPNEVVVVKKFGTEIVKRIVRTDGNGYWVEGDNKDYSTDSREFGAVIKGDLTGRVMFGK